MGWRREGIFGIRNLYVNLCWSSALNVLGGEEMKMAKAVFIGLLIVLLVSVPVAAEAHWAYGGGAILGFGAGLITGLVLAPRPVYVAPPVYYAPPPPVVYRSSPYYAPAPAPPGPAAHGYSNNADVSTVNPPPPGQSRCREWRLIDQHWQNRWDSYSGRWQNVLVERWGWVGVPCSN
jgi:hypothetical protein